MTAGLSRRDALLQTAAIAAASAMPGARFARAAVSPHALSNTSEIDAILQAAVDAAEVPGVVAMVATEHGVIYRGAFGLRGMNATPKMSTDTVFRIASMIKVLTSVAAMQLVERGKLGLDEPAAKIDPTLGLAQVLAGFDAKGVPQLRPPRKPITLRDLLAHTSGFSYPLWDADLIRYLKLAHGNPALPRMPLMFDPEAKWAYGGSLDRVGRLVEIVSATNLDLYFREHILGPLGMKDTGFSVTEAQRGREAHLHVRQADGTLIPQPVEKPKVRKVFSGGGGIYSTAPDYLTLLRALLNRGGFGGKHILRAEQVAAMSANQIGNLEAGILKTTNPNLSNDVDFFPGLRLRWGLGHMINLDPVPDGRKAASLTWAGLYNTYYWIDPASGIAAVIMMQILPFADGRALNLYRRFERGVYRALQPA
jgi:methyl acetate hydrolase